MQMNRRQLLEHMLVAGAALASHPLRGFADDRQERLFRDAPFVNASDLTTVGSLPGYPTGSNFNAEYIARLKQGRFTVVSASLVFWLYDDFYEAARRIHDFHRLAKRHPDDLRMVWNYADIAAAEAEGKIAILMHAHTPSIIGNDLRRLEILQMLGLRIIGFSHQQRSLLAEGAGEDLHDGDGGLSRFGVAVLKEMNRLQMVADLGHASDQSILQAARISEQPIIVSHTCVRALSDHRSPSLLQRNISDDAIRAVADNQGVVGIMALTPHLLAEQSDRKPSIELYLDHIEHVIDLAGIDHVGIGTETGHGTTADTMRQVMAEVTGRLGDNTPAIDTFRAVANLPPGTALVVPGMEDMSRAKYNLIGEMIRRGYSDEAIEKILGRNFLRVYQAVLPA